MIEDWRSLVIFYEKGELRQGCTRGYKPRRYPQPSRARIICTFPSWRSANPASQ
jgi:hypothetical protein